MAKDSDGAIIVSCLFLFFKVFILVPLFSALLYGVLSSMENVPTWVWVVFWTYGPIAILTALLGGVCEAVLKKE